MTDQTHDPLLGRDVMVFGFFTKAGLKMLCKVAADDGVAACDALMDATKELVAKRVGVSLDQFNETMRQMLVQNLMDALDEFEPKTAPKAAAASYCLAKMDAPNEANFEETRFLLVTRDGDDLSIEAFHHEERFKRAIQKFIGFAPSRPTTETLH